MTPLQLAEFLIQCVLIVLSALGMHQLYFRLFADWIARQESLAEVDPPTWASRLSRLVSCRFCLSYWFTLLALGLVLGVPVWLSPQWLWLPAWFAIGWLVSQVTKPLRMSVTFPEGAKPEFPWPFHPQWRLWKPEAPDATSGPAVPPAAFAEIASPPEPSQTAEWSSMPHTERGSEHPPMAQDFTTHPPLH